MATDMPVKSDEERHADLGHEPDLGFSDEGGGVVGDSPADDDIAQSMP